MNDMNELTNKLQQVMVPKAALIAYEYLSLIHISEPTRP